MPHFIFSAFPVPLLPLNILLTPMVNIFPLIHAWMLNSWTVLFGSYFLMWSLSRPFPSSHGPSLVQAFITSHSPDGNNLEALPLAVQPVRFIGLKPFSLYSCIYSRGPDIILGSGNTAMNKADKNPCPHGVYIPLRARGGRVAYGDRHFTKWINDRVG